MLTTPISLTGTGVVRGMRRLAPVSLFVIPFGMAFGAASLEAGMDPAQSIIMSLLVFAGASQFAALEVWDAPIPFISLALLTLAVNARHIILGAALSPWINQLPPTKQVGALLLLSDANFADTHPMMKDGHRDLGILLGGGIMLWGTWLIGTAVGALLGNQLGPLEPFGVDVVMAAFFLSTLVGSLRSRLRGTMIPVGVAIVVAVVAKDFLPAGWNIIVAALCGGIAGVLHRDA